jgi:periplasmic protein TonB
MTDYEPGETENTERQRKKTADKAPREEESGDGPVNSVASLPSIASEERRMLSAGGSDMEDFRSRILAAIREAIYFPKEALTRKKHGEIVVRFTVNRDGSVSDLSVVQASGSPFLDEAALAIIRRAAKAFPSIPVSLAPDRISYAVPIHFKEKRSRAEKN